MDAELHCDSCGIKIGKGYLEPIPYQSGKYTFCGWCWDRFQRDDHIELKDRARNNGVISCTWLMVDGSTQKMKMVKDKQGKFSFAPLVKRKL